MMQQIANFIVDHDPMMVLRRTADTVRYTRWAWNKGHTNLIDEEELRLFLCDERRGDLTDEQKAVARRCRDEMRCVYEEMYLRSLQCAIMLERGMVPVSVPTAACSARKEVMRHGFLTKRDDCLFRKAPQSG